MCSAVVDFYDDIYWWFIKGFIVGSIFEEQKTTKCYEGAQFKHNLLHCNIIIYFNLNNFNCS